MRILVTRPESEIARFAAQLRAQGIEAIAAPLLRIEPAASLPPAPTDMQALVFTSANGVRAYAALEARRDLPVFTVGDATAEAARAAGFANVASAGGDWRALATLIAEKLDPAGGPLLHPAGEDRAGDLAGVLAAGGFALASVTVYRAVPAAALPAAARAAIAAGEVDGVALFSPRSAGIFTALIAAAGLAEKRARLEAYCLSAPVAEALGEPAAWRAVRVAARPNAEALLAVIRARDSTPKDEPEVAKTMNDDRAAYTGNDAERIIAAFGGIRPMAKAMGIAVTTVQGWKERGAIPLKRMDDIRASAARAGIDLEAALAAPLAESSASEPGSAGVEARPAAEAVAAEKIARAPEPGLRAAEAAPPPPPRFDAAPARTAPPSGRARWAFWGAGFGAAFIVGVMAAMALGLGGRSGGDIERQALDRLQSRINTITSQLEEQQKRQQGEAAALQARINRVEAAERAIGEQRERVAALAGNAAALASRLEKLDMDLKALAARAAAGAPAGADEVKGLKEQIEALAKKIEGLSRETPDGPGIAAQLKQLTDRLAAVEKRAGELAEARPSGEGAWKEALEIQAAAARATAEKIAADSAQLRKDVAALQARMASLADDVQKSAANGAGPLVVAIGQLRRSVLDGAPYRPALEAAAALAKDRADMAPAFAALAVHAERGIATPAQLRQRFDRVAVAALRAAAAPGAAADFWDRVWSRVQSLVTVRRTGEVPGETAAAHIARAETALARGDLAEALKQTSALTGPAREAASGWIGDAKARLVADAALAKLDQAVLGLLRATEPKARP